MVYLPNIIFLLMLLFGIGLFVRNIKKIIKNIKLGKPIDSITHKKERWTKVLRIAIGQSKMVKRPISGILHIVVYIGFIVINIEVLEIIYDGLTGSHRAFAKLGPFYDVLIGSFEVLAALVIVAVLVFWIRRNSLRIARFIKPEMKGWPKKDANIILYFELVLMSLFLLMNTTDLALQQLQVAHYNQAGAFPISQLFLPLFEGFSTNTLIIIERSAWWLHIAGILVFLNYLYYSKHLHIMLAFPNVYYGSVTPKGQFANNKTVTKEVQLMLDPNADPFAAPASDAPPEKFGASDVTDLTQVQLLNAYTCTECGRCTSVCPANLTGKALSPRKIMMDVRDRITELGNTRDKKQDHTQDNQLLDNYISREELWACTSCNACVEACPVEIDPLAIIMDMRAYLVMEQSAAPNELNITMTNIENNGAPWPFNQMDRAQWTTETT